jgi:polyisoprenoid-binding protein YceI
MKIKSLVYIFATFLLFSSVSSAATYEVDPSHTQVLFKVRHLGISNVTGLFSEFTGTLEFDPNAVVSSSVKAEVSVASIDTQDKKRDDHLRGEDFFNVKKSPSMRFQSKKIKDAKGDNFTVVGDLTINGVTKTIELDTEFLGAAKDPWGNERVAFEASAKINRKDFGLTWNKLLESGSLLVGEEVKIILEVEAIKKK